MIDPNHFSYTTPTSLITPPNHPTSVTTPTPVPSTGRSQYTCRSVSVVETIYSVASLRANTDSRLSGMITIVHDHQDDTSVLSVGSCRSHFEPPVTLPSPVPVLTPARLTLSNHSVHSIFVNDLPTVPNLSITPTQDNINFILKPNDAPTVVPTVSQRTNFPFSVSTDTISVASPGMPSLATASTSLSIKTPVFHVDPTTTPGVVPPHSPTLSSTVPSPGFMAANPYYSPFESVHFRWEADIQRRC